MIISNALLPQGFKKRGWEGGGESRRDNQGPMVRKMIKLLKLSKRVKETTTCLLLISFNSLFPQGFIQGAGKGIGRSTRGKQDPKTVKNSKTIKFEEIQQNK